MKRAVLALLVPLIAAADCPVPSGFREVEPNLHRIAFLKDHLNSANSSIRLTCGFATSCSGAFISDSCHILTALHCIKPCLVGAKATRDQGMYSTIDRAKASSLEIVFESKRYHDGRLVASGPGWFAPWIADPTDEDAKKIKSQAKTLLPKLKEISRTQGIGPTAADWAIVQIPEVQCGACSPLARGEPKPGEPIYVVGFPGETDRETGGNSDGLHQYYSDGAVLAETDWNAREKPRGPFALRYSEAIGDFGMDALPSSADTYVGSSGSPTFDSTGAVVGVVSESTADRDHYDPRKYYTVSIRASTIRKGVTAQLPPEEAARVFQCTNN